MIDATYADGLATPEARPERRRPNHPESTRRNLSALGQSWEHPNLFSQVVGTPTRSIEGMVRGSDPETSQAAACRVLPKLGKVEAMTLALIRSTPSTARELANNPIFKGVCDPNTVRTRTSALKRKGLIRDTGDERDGCAVWEAVP